MKRILVPLDGSELAESALPLAAALARDYEAELVLLRALLPQGSPDDEFTAQEHGERYLVAMRDRLLTEGVTGVEWKVWYEPPDQAIISAAIHTGVDLIAMATHGRGGLGRMLFGSVAESVVRRAAVPVLLVRGVPAWRSGNLRGILVPLDGSEVSETVLPIVTRLAGPFDLAVNLLRVLEPLPSSALAELQATELIRLGSEEAESHLAKIAESLEAMGLRVAHAVRAGAPVNTILQEASEPGIGLIAMSTHGRTGFERLLLGSVAERVLRAAPVPVLLWKARSRAAEGGQ